MRLWHYKLLPYLPNSQLISQWRELNSIFKKQDNHILINYIYGYPKEDIRIYSDLVINELTKRGIKIKSFDKYLAYFNLPNTYMPTYDHNDINAPFKKHHHKRYLMQCFYNLQEKYDRHQKDFSDEQYKRLKKFITEEIT